MSKSIITRQKILFDKNTPIIVLLGRKQGFKEGIQGDDTP